MQVVLFEKGKTRFVQLATERRYKKNPNAVINPRLYKVQGVPIKYWKKGGGRKIVAMSQAERGKVDDKLGK